MKQTVLFFYFLIISISAFGQNQASSDKEMSDDKIKFEEKYKNAKHSFVDERYDKVVAYYDSILNISSYTRITTYKMAYDSYQQLILKHPENNDSLKTKADDVYNQALKWYGEMYLEKKWDNIVIDPNAEKDYFNVIEKSAEYPGGISAFYSYISENITYPIEAKKNGIEGKVYVTFMVNIDGTIDAVNVIRGIDSECDAEAVRVISKANKFIPASTKGEPQFVRMQIPINFGLISTYEAKSKKRIRKRNKNKS